MSIFNDAMNIINDGLSGKNIGIPFDNMPKLTEYIYGVRQSTFYLIGGETGLGKTKFARDQFMYSVYDYYKEHENELDVRFLDFSMEISPSANMINAIIRRVYKKHHRLLNYRTVMGLTKDIRLSDEQLKLIEDERSYFEDFEKKLIVVDGMITPTKYHDVLLHHFKKEGTFENNSQTAISRVGQYKPSNPQLLTVGIVDTVNLTDTEPGQTNKQSIDRVSAISIKFRNQCGYTPIIVQQFNADNSDIQRQRHGIKTPMLRDFEDSKRVTKDF